MKDVPRYSFTIDDHLYGLRVRFDHDEVEAILEANGYSNLRLLHEDDPRSRWVCDGPEGAFLHMTCVMRDILHERLMDLLTR